MVDYLIPMLLLVSGILVLHRKENAYGLLLDGAKDGLNILFSIIPALVLLMVAIHMLRASEAIALFSKFLSPIFHYLGIPPETAILVLIRPLSGTAALAVGAQLMAEYGPDSMIGRTVAVMLGSTETTFYTISVYFSAAGIQKTRYTIPAALFGDFVGFLMASLTTKLLW